MIIYSPPKTADAIPVIDITESYSPNLDQRRKVAWEIHKACRDTGFFYITGHGVPKAIIDNQLELTRRFFDLPVDAKNAVRLDKAVSMRGYEPPALQKLDVGSPGDLKESFMMGPEPDSSQIKSEEWTSEGANRWPKELPEFEAQMLRYRDHVVRLGTHLMASLALSLDMPEDYFAEGLNPPGYAVRLLRYPPHPVAAEFNQLGAGAHTDWGAITMLLQDNVGGLEVQNAEGDWIRATPIPDTFVINLGDLIPRFTNGLYHSNMHRVLNNSSGKNRHSVATFFNLEESYQVECLPTCLPDNGVLQFEPATVGEHLNEMFRKTYSIA